MNVLIACEESQVECIAFRGKGFRAFSCDLQHCSGGFPGWHICGDVSEVLYPPCIFLTEDGEEHFVDKWDLVIAHPPCTYFCRPQSQYIMPNSKNYRPERWKDVLKAKEFFMMFLDLDTRVAVENPVPLKIVGLPLHSACANPYEFGDPYSKLTYYWLKGLPPLFPTCICLEHKMWVNSGRTGCGVANSAKERSKSFPGISQAMADQWGDYLKKNYKR